MYPGFDIVPVDGSSPDTFAGVDFTVTVRSSSIHDVRQIEEEAIKVLERSLSNGGFKSRRFRLPGVGSPATGAPPFYEFLVWIHENFEFLSGIASTLVGRFVFLRSKAYLIKRKVDDRVLDPYRPSVVIELLVRTDADRSRNSEDAATSLGAFLQHLPLLSTRLAEELPGQSFTLRVANKAGVLPYTHFKVSSVRRSDVARVVRYMKNHGQPKGVNSLHLYRQFGFLTRLKSIKSMDEFFRIMFSY